MVRRDNVMKKFIAVCLVVLLLVSSLAVSAYAVKYGDIDLNNAVEIQDAVLLAKYLAQWNINISNEALTNADVHKDGKVDAIDAVKLAQYLAQWDVTLGPSATGGIGDIEVNGDDLFG